MFTFAFAVFFLFITPGPWVLSAAGVGSAYGYRKGVRYFIGLFIGTNIVSLAVISGLASIMMSNPPMRALFCSHRLDICFISPSASPFPATGSPS